MRKKKIMFGFSVNETFGSSVNKYYGAEKNWMMKNMTPSSNLRKHDNSNARTQEIIKVWVSKRSVIGYKDIQ